MKIDWDKEELERNVRSGEGEFRLLDFWVPIQVYIEGVDISGLDKVPRGDISQFDTLFLNIFFVFKSIDPEKLGDTEFCYIASCKNEVFAGGFKFFVDYDKLTDFLAIKYINFVNKEFQFLNVPLKQFTEGFLLSTKKLLEEIENIDAAYRGDEEFIILKDNMGVIFHWYKEKYGEGATLEL